MGQKIHPKSFRVGVTEKWPVRWFFSSSAHAGGGKSSEWLGSRRIYARFLEEDEAIRNAIYSQISQAGVSAIGIERTANNVRILIKAARPGLVIGRGGKGIEDLAKGIEKRLKKIRGENYAMRMSVNVEELKRSEISAAYTAQQIAWDMEKRLPYRRTMKKYLDRLMQYKEVKGAKILLSGRIGGAEIARKEMLKDGSLPLHTIRAVIDYGVATAFTTYGTIGIKVWVYVGENNP